MLFSLATSYMYTHQQLEKKQNGTVDHKKWLFEVDFYTMLGLIVIEFICMIVAILMAVKCGQKHDQLFLNILGAIFFPIIYIIYALVTGCYKGSTFRY